MKKLPPITIVVLFLGLMFLYFPLALVFGEIQTFWSGRAGGGVFFSLLDASVCLGLCLFVVLTLLVWPMAFAGYLDAEQSWTRVPQVVLLWSMPSVAFGYFVGEFRGVIQAYDYAIAILLPVVAGVVFFRRTGKWLETSVLIGCSFFLGLFLIGDILGPFPTFVRFASSSTTVYTLRTVLSFLALSAVLFLPVVCEESIEERREVPLNWMFGLSGLGVLLVGARQILTTETVWYASDLLPLTVLLSGWVFFSDRFSPRVRVLVGAGQVIALLVPLSRAFTASGADLYTQSLVGYQTLVLVAFAWAWFSQGRNRYIIRGKAAASRK